EPVDDVERVRGRIESQPDDALAEVVGAELWRVRSVAGREVDVPAGIALVDGHALRRHPDAAATPVRRAAPHRGRDNAAAPQARDVVGHDPSVRAVDILATRRTKDNGLGAGGVLPDREAGSNDLLAIAEELAVPPDRETIDRL